MRAGFIGLGSQGGGMAQAIQEAGHELWLWARRPEVLAPYLARGAKRADTPAALAALADVLGLCVVSEADVRELLFDRGVLEAMRPGTVLAIHSTIHPVACRTLADTAAKHGVALIDAPVSGGGQAAAKGRLLVMVGGSERAYARALPVLRSFGEPVRHLGPVGTGQTAKLVNNFLFFGTLALSRVALDLGEGLGLDRKTLREIMSAGSGKSFALEVEEWVLTEQSAPQTRHLFTKDRDIVMELARAKGLQVGPMLDCADWTIDYLKSLTAAERD